MTRYIDAEKFEKEMYHEAFETDSDMQKWDSGCWIRYKMLENCIAQQPIADVVEVVRCCKCKNYEHMKQSNECVCSEYGGRVTENDFCSRAVLAD